jgi:hypothetical protein
MSRILAAMCAYAQYAPKVWRLPPELAPQHLLQSHATIEKESFQRPRSRGAHTETNRHD